MNLRRASLMAALLSAALASIATPGWAETLRAKGYGDYVDLALSLVAPPALVAGGDVAVSVQVTNAGPGTADIPIVLLNADATSQFVASFNCIAPTSPLQRCQLPAIAANETQSASLQLHLDPFARGTLLIGAAATSEAIEMNPGNELRVAAAQIFALVETRAVLENPVPDVLGDGRLAWTVHVDNFGPSAAVAPQFLNNSSASSQPVQVECTAIGVASCPSAQNYLGPGGHWTLRFTAPPLSEANPQILIDMAVLPVELGNTPNNDAVTLYYRDALFADGVE